MEARFSEAFGCVEQHVALFWREKKKKSLLLAAMEGVFTLSKKKKKSLPSLDSEYFSENFQKVQFRQDPCIWFDVAYRKEMPRARDSGIPAKKLGKAVMNWREQEEIRVQGTARGACLKSLFSKCWGHETSSRVP